MSGFGIVNFTVVSLLFVFSRAKYSVNSLSDFCVFDLFEKVTFFIGGFVLASVFDLVLQALLNLLLEAETVFCTLLLDYLDQLFIFFFLDLSLDLLICFLSKVFLKVSSYIHGHVATDIVLLSYAIQIRVFRFFTTSLQLLLLYVRFFELIGISVLVLLGLDLLLIEAFGIPFDPRQLLSLLLHCVSELEHVGEVLDLDLVIKDEFALPEQVF